MAAATELVAPIPFTATAPDGNVVQAWVLPPAGADLGRGERYPTLLNIHGDVIGMARESVAFWKPYVDVGR